MPAIRKKSRKWFYPVIYSVLIVISMLPPITEVPYNPENTQDVITAILMVSIKPYQSWGWVFHVGTLLVFVLPIFSPAISGRVISAYFGVNYLIIAAIQTNAVTEKYGFAIQTGALLYVVYNYIAYIFTMPINWSTLPYLVLVIGSLYLALTIIKNIDTEAVKKNRWGKYMKASPDGC